MTVSEPTLFHFCWPDPWLWDLFLQLDKALRHISCCIWIMVFAWNSQFLKRNKKMWSVRWVTVKTNDCVFSSGGLPLISLMCNCFVEEKRFTVSHVDVRICDNAAFESKCLVAMYWPAKLNCGWKWVWRDCQRADSCWCICNMEVSALSPYNSMTQSSRDWDMSHHLLGH